METLMESVEDDEDWLKAAPEATHDDTVLLQRASLALQHSFAASPNENTRLALTNLLKFGLAAEMSVVPGVSTELSHYTADLLNFSTTNKKPCPHHFNLRIGDHRYRIPERSRFFFLRLSYVLQSNIFLFSSRAKPVLFQPKENATRTLAFFHSISSYTSISQFLVLTASGHVPCPMEIQQVELSQYTNPISPATFRDAPRKIQARGREDDSALTGPVLKRAFARALGLEEVQLHLDQSGKAAREEGTTSAATSEGSEDAQKELRTCTITLGSILRPDLEQQQETVVRLLSEAQEKITDVVMYLAITAQKLYLLLSEGKLYERVGNETPQFDCKSLLPPEFEWDEKIPSKITVAPLPSDLQESLEKASSQPKSNQSDMARFFSQDHLQFMLTRLMGTQQAARGVPEVVDDKDDAKDGPHELWEKGLQLVKRASDLSQVPEPIPGLSHTITEAIREFSTALNNMWDGRMYKKALRYLCRIALRLQLAPTIDRNVKASTERAKLRKQEQQQKREARTALTKKQWKNRIKELFDSLGDLQEQSTTQRIDEICKAIADLEEPQSIQHRIMSIEERLNMSGSSAVAAVETDAEAAWSVHQDMMTTANDGADDESSSNRLRALESVLIMLVESPHIENGVVDSNWVQKCAYKGHRFTVEECAVVAQLANSLRPFAPKRTINDEGYYEEPQAHVANQAALVRIANTFLMGTGYDQFTQLESPRVSPSSLHALALGPVGIYETLCARTAGHYDIQDVNGTLLSN
ncbi:unnamed protein product [Mortierella alpina]